MPSTRILSFNSHPHKEDDDKLVKMYKVLNLSTHILTRRMTILFQHLFYNIPLSTHILTRRMTVAFHVFLLCLQPFNSHPHKEDDNHDPDAILMHKTFQLTSSQGG